MGQYIILRLSGWSPSSSILKSVEKEMLNKSNHIGIRSVCSEAFNKITEDDTEAAEMDKFNKWVCNRSNRTKFLFKMHNREFRNITNRKKYYQIWYSGDKCSYCKSLCTKKGEIKIENNRICILR